MAVTVADRQKIIADNKQGEKDRFSRGSGGFINSKDKVIGVKAYT